MDIHFTAEDVLEYFRTRHKEEGDFAFLDHELTSDIGVVHMNAGFMFEGHAALGPLPSIHQQAYALGVSSSTQLIAGYVGRLVSTLAREEFPDDEVLVTSREFHHTSSLLVRLLPATPAVLALGALSAERREFLESADSYAELAIYTYNLHFARGWQRETFNLGSDISLFMTSSPGARTHLHMPSALETKADYFANAVFPLIKNAQQHAFDGAKGDVNIIGTADEQHKQYVITVQDGGKGIAPEVLPRLFERGASTKHDVREHGVGLWAVKNFVETSGGAISVKTSEKGTAFTITIPYSEKRGIIYVQ